MNKAPSEATQIRTLRAQLREKTATASDIADQRDHYRARATKAEQEVKEWKRRVDALLFRSDGEAK